jgi:hypothetical protein
MTHINNMETTLLVQTLTCGSGLINGSQQVESMSWSLSLNGEPMEASQSCKSNSLVI